VRRGAIPVLALLVAACVDNAVQPVAFCALAEEQPDLFPRVIETQAVGLFSDHGAYLSHPDCPSETMLWSDAASFADDPSSDELDAQLGRMTRTSMQAETLDSEDLSVTVVASYERLEGHRSLVVRRVLAMEPAPRVYRDELQRQDERCYLGRGTGIDPEGTRAACERVQVLRGERHAQQSADSD
jgi:hypothetical protein